MKQSRLAVMVAVLAWSLAGLGEETPARLYNAGNAAYARGEFSEAIKNYRAALGQGGFSPDLFYNLGNACLKAGQLGPAILAYERALRMNPRDPDLAHNLRYARVQIRGKLPTVERGLMLQTWDRARDSFSLNELLALFSAGWFLLGGGLALRLFFRQPFLRLAASITLGLGIAILLLDGPLGAAKFQKEVLTRPAVILEARTPARSGPGSQNAELFELFEGMEVIVNKCESGSCEVRVPGGLAGWIQTGTFEVI